VSCPCAAGFLNDVGTAVEDVPSAIPRWRTTPDDDGQYVYAVALR